MVDPSQTFSQTPCNLALISLVKFDPQRSFNITCCGITHGPCPSKWLRTPKRTTIHQTTNTMCKNVNNTCDLAKLPTSMDDDLIYLLIIGESRVWLQVQSTINTINQRLPESTLLMIIGSSDMNAWTGWAPAIVFFHLLWRILIFSPNLSWWPPKALPEISLFDLYWCGRK